MLAYDAKCDIDYTPIKELQEQVSNFFQVDFNYTTLTVYPNHNSYIKSHSDIQQLEGLSNKLHEEGTEVVVGISIYGGRLFTIKHHLSQQEVVFAHKENSVVVMRGCQFLSNHSKGKGYYNLEKSFQTEINSSNIHISAIFRKLLPPTGGTKAIYTSVPLKWERSGEQWMCKTLNTLIKPANPYQELIDNEAINHIWSN